MELKAGVQHHDLEAAEALVSMSVWGQRSHKLRPLTPTSDSCDSVHLLPGEGADPAKDLIALSSLVIDLLIRQFDLMTSRLLGC